MKKKIIHLYSRSYDSYFPQKNSEYYYLAGWSGTVAKQTVRLGYENDYEVELWRPEREIEKPLMLEVQGVICRLFPAKYIKHFGDWSFSLLRELKKQAKKNEILIHHSSIHSNFLYLIAYLFRHVPIIAQHHGDRSRLSKFQQNIKLISLINNHIEKRMLKYVDHFYVLRNDEKIFLSKLLPESHITLQTMGVDFAKFKPHDRKKTRKELNLPEDKKIILYVGKFYKLKGIDIILRIFEDIKSMYDAIFLLVGGSSSDPLYKDVELSGTYMRGYIPHKEIPLYFSAADVYLLPAFSSEYYGIDVSVMESLACGTPVVSPILKEFPSNELYKIGKIPKDENDVVRCISDVLDNPSNYSNCRKIAKNIFSWERIIDNTIKQYEYLFRKYYD